MKPALVVHTTEGTSIEGAVQTMRRNRSECHEVFDPQTGQTEQLTPWTESARSLRHPSGTPETNRRGFTLATVNQGKVYQVEIVGFAQKVTDRMYSGEWFQAVAEYLADRCRGLGVPIVFPYPFGGSEGYGKNGAYRLTWEQWATVSGIVGHSHVPGNMHWDPGDFAPVVALIEGDGASDQVVLPGSRDATIRRIQWAAGVVVDGDPYVKTAAAVEGLAEREGALRGEVQRLRGLLSEIGRLASSAQQGGGLSE